MKVNNYFIQSCIVSFHCLFVGPSCATALDQCINDPCGVNATCESLPPGTTNVYGLSYNCSNCIVGQELSEGKCVDAGEIFYWII